MDIIVKNIEEWEKLIENGDVKISTTIVESILKNLNVKKRFIYMLGVYIEDTKETFDITLDRKNFIETLEENLPIQEKHENFERCTQIINAIKYLKGY